MLHLYAAIAEKERSVIAARTKAALAAAKIRGVQLGNPEQVRRTGVRPTPSLSGCGPSSSSSPPSRFGVSQDRGAAR
jgi:hypothetical protein